MAVWNDIGELIHLMWSNDETSFTREDCDNLAKENYYVSDNDGHLTINYNQLANDVFAADFRKQVYGEWLPKETMIRTITAKNYTCSVCGYENGTTPFCPNCGAKMKGNN